jgi:hypothetical protein
VGAIVCKLDFHKKVVKRGYIAMLAVDSCHRKRKIGSTLVKRAIDAMIAEDADEVLKNDVFLQQNIENLSKCCRHKVKLVNFTKKFNQIFGGGFISG